MKKYFSLFLILSACSTSESIDPNQEIVIEEKSTSEFMIDSQTISIEVSKIEDSRCPENVVCVWAGEAKVTFDIIINQKLFSDEQLCLQCDQESGIPQEVLLENRRLELIAINPYPDSEVSTSIKSVTFKVN